VASPLSDQSDLQPNALAAEGHAFTRAVKGGEPKEGPPSGVPKQAGPEALPFCRRLEQSPKGEATELSPLFLPLHFYFAFSAQKSHVKPQNLSKTR
jgi:hypothetical protein